MTLMKFRAYVYLDNCNNAVKCQCYKSKDRVTGTDFWTLCHCGIGPCCYSVQTTQSVHCSSKALCRNGKVSKSLPGSRRWRFGNSSLYRFWPIHPCDGRTEGRTELRWLRRAESSSCFRA